MRGKVGVHLMVSHEDLDRRSDPDAAGGICAGSVVSGENVWQWSVLVTTHFQASSRHRVGWYFPALRWFLWPCGMVWPMTCEWRHVYGFQVEANVPSASMTGKVPKDGSPIWVPEQGWQI